MVSHCIERKLFKLSVEPFISFFRFIEQLLTDAVAFLHKSKCKSFISHIQRLHIESVLYHFSYFNSKWVGYQNLRVCILWEILLALCPLSRLNTTFGSNSWMPKNKGSIVSKQILKIDVIENLSLLMADRAHMHRIKSHWRERIWQNKESASFTFLHLFSFSLLSLQGLCYFLNRSQECFLS